MDMNYKQCLTCLGTSRDMRHFQSAVTIGGEEVRLNDILSTFYNYKVPEIHEPPENLCVSCVHQLTVTYSFKILMENTAKKLSAKMYDMKSPDNDDNDQDDDSDNIAVVEIECLPKQEQSPKAKAVENIAVVEIECLPKQERSPEAKAVEKRQWLGLNNVRKPKCLYCVECKTPFYSVPSLKKHCSENHPIKNTIGRACEFCFEKFDIFRSALLHKKMHYKPYICEDCWYGFDTNEDLSSHNCKNPDKPGKETNTQCDQCGKYYQRNYIKIHMLTHKEERTYSCKECPKRFKVLNGLQSHVKWAHKRMKNYKCEFCSAMFVTSSARSIHVRKIHLREKKHVCECGKSFFSKCDLERHMFTHTGAKNYHCHMCDKAYQTRYGLNVHLKSHSQMNMNVLNM